MGAEQSVLTLEAQCSAMVWTGVGTDEFIFPELRDDEDGVPALKSKPSFAVCLSGGGFRATTCALGWMVALKEQGLLPKIRYLCSNSGGSWFNSCFSYQDMVSNDEFLGSYIPPAELTADALMNHSKMSYASVIDDASMLGSFLAHLGMGVACMDFLRDEDKTKFRAWGRAVGDAFLDRHGLNDPKSTFALSGESANRARNAGVETVHTAMRSDDMPFPIVVATVMPPGDERVFFSFEFTPLYCGCPARIEDVEPMPLGYCLVEPFATSSKPPQTDTRDVMIPGQRSTCQLDTQWVLPLNQAAGISSQYIAQNYAHSSSEGFWETMGCPELHYWNGVDFQGMEMCFGDGGGTDNMAIFPALRRGVENILICAAVGNPPVDESWTAFNYDLSGYFGRVPEGSGPDVASGKIKYDVYNTMEQVFEADKWDELLAKFIELEKDGKPLVVRIKLQVLENKTQGVKGGYEADTVWVLNGGKTQWLEQLPPESQDLVGDIEGFPYISVNKLNYEPELTGALSQLCAWNLHQALPEVNQMLETEGGCCVA